VVKSRYARCLARYLRATNQSQLLGISIRLKRPSLMLASMEMRVGKQCTVRAWSRRIQVALEAARLLAIRFTHGRHR
jgi:hypothetical protein